MHLEDAIRLLVFWRDWHIITYYLFYIYPVRCQRSDKFPMMVIFFFFLYLLSHDFIYCQCVIVDDCYQYQCSDCMFGNNYTWHLMLLCIWPHYLFKKKQIEASREVIITGLEHEWKEKLFSSLVGSLKNLFLEAGFGCL